MKCPKCSTILSENQTICPKCHKVLSLTCPNCGSISESSLCEKCGYIILTKCSKCGKTVPTNRENCKCGFPIKTSLAYQECEVDEFASVIVKFNSLKKIKKILKSQELYTKFYFRLKNLLLAQIKGIDCKYVIYDDVFVINFNKELSFATSSNKATRFSLKVINAFVNLNKNILEELAIPLNLSLTIVKKYSEQLLELTMYDNNVKPLILKKDSKRYLKGFQIVLDQFVRDEINKEYKTDSLYSIEENGVSTVFYEIILDSYILPPNTEKEEAPINAIKKDISSQKENIDEFDINSFKVFDINAKCNFVKIPTSDFFNKLAGVNLDKEGKIIALRSKPELGVFTSDIVEFYKKQDYKVLSVSCTEELNYKPWGFFEVLFKDYFNLSSSKNNDFTTISQNNIQYFNTLFDFINGKPVKAMTPEDARFAYMEQWNKFLAILDKTLILVEGFENIDDTSLQTLELYFDKFKKIKPNFAFITSDNLSVHSKIKGLLRTNLYTEFSLCRSTIDSCLSSIKSDATDFIQSFYFEKIKENFNGSYLYFQNSLEYLKDCSILIDFDNKLLIQNKKSVVLPKDLEGLYKARLKHLCKKNEKSFILAYSSMISPRLDIKTLSQLGISDVENHIKSLISSKLVYYKNEIVYINNFSLILPIIRNSLKQDAESYLAKNMIANLGKFLDDTTMAFLMGKLSKFKEEYLTLWKNSQFAIKTGDYDAYLKNCLGFLSLVEYINTNISIDIIEDNKKDVYNNILMFLYNYSPAKIYFIENILLMDAINENDNEKIVKLSNLMLQGALISSNYSDALGLLHNILSRMQNPMLIVEGVINTKFFLLTLVKIEILYNIGEFKQAVELADEILSVLSQNIIEKIKPAGFSTNLFVSHIIDILRLVAFAKLYLLDNDLDEFFEKIKKVLNVEFPEKDCILAIKDFLSGKIYEMGNVEEYSPFSKVIFLILQEFSALKDDYKRFAQNIYQAKLLASEINQREFEMFCDLLIAYAYYKIGISKKAEFIYTDVLESSKKMAMFNIITLSKYFLAKLHLPNNFENGLLLINDALALIRKNNNDSKIIYTLFEKLYIETAKNNNLDFVDIEAEEQKIIDYKDKLSILMN